MKPFVLSLFSLALALSAEGLSPEAESYLQSIGLDPTSEDVRLAEAAGNVQTTYMDEPVSYSVESLAQEKKKNGLIRFVTTRAFIHRLHKNFNETKIPKKNYEALYLTVAERELVGRKVAMFLLKGAAKTSKRAARRADSMAAVGSRRPAAAAS